MTAFSSSVRQIFGRRRLIWSQLYGGGDVAFGWEVVRSGEGYVWDGLTRSGDRRRPRWLFQLTLDGWGLLETKRPTRVPAGSAFVVRIPSAHRYRADPECGAWEFCWLMLTLPEADIRFSRHASFANQVVPFATDGEAAVALLRLGTMMRRQEVDFRIEEALFAWLLAFERETFSRSHPRPPRQRLLESVRRMVHDQLEHPLTVENVAATHGMSRSHFSHHFQAVTGLAPAAFIRETRVEAAAALLRDSGLSVKEIAARTGFADSSMFGKCFRSVFQMTPGEYQRLGRRKLSVGATVIK